jgi:hypothetical protein
MQFRPYAIRVNPINIDYVIAYLPPSLQYNKPLDLLDKIIILNDVNLVEFDGVERLAIGISVIDDAEFKKRFTKLREFEDRWPTPVYRKL